MTSYPTPIGNKIRPGFLLKEGRKGKFLHGTIKVYGNTRGAVEEVVRK